VTLVNVIRIVGIALAAALLASFLAVAEGPAKNSPPDIGLQGAQWLSPGADVLAALTETPGECLKPAEDAETAYLMEVGRTAFRSPLLFGGPAARSGLSCNSCHLDGHDNPEFFVPGLSGAPGTADVTSSLFSKVREDGVHNPLVIPTLVDAAEKTSFGTASPQPSIEAFTESAVEDEFQGAPPPPAIIKGVAAYVGHLSADACPAAPVRQSARRAIDDVSRAVAAAKAALERGDGPTADFLMVSAQHAAGLVHDRYSGPKLADERAALVGLSRDLGGARRLAESDPAQGAEALAAVEAALPEIAENLHKRRKKSLYDVKTLRRALED